MKRFSIPYGKGQLTLSLPADRVAGEVAARPAPSDPRPAEVIIADALANPIASPALRDLARGKARVLVITSDHTRPMPSAITLPPLLAQIRAGNPHADIRILIATGTHRAMTPQEQRARFGEALCARETILCHDCDRDAMAAFGTLPSGGSLHLNAQITWADLIVSEGFIEPHFFAGFSGGRKSILPGIAARASVQYNHNAAFLADPHAAQGCLDQNPLHRDMAFAAKAAGLRFIHNVLLDPQKRIIAAFAGDPEAAHAAGCKACLYHTQAAAVTADIAVTSNGGYPLDQNLYQSVKGMTAGEACVREGGVIILCAALQDGAGGEGFQKMVASAENPVALWDRIAATPPEETKEDQWQAQILARVLQKARVIIVTGAENRALIESMHMAWAGSLPDALAAAENTAGPQAKVAVIPDGVGVIIR